MKSIDLTKKQIIEKYRGKISPSLLLQVDSEIDDLGYIFDQWKNVQSEKSYFSKIYQETLWENIVTNSDLNKLNKFLFRWKDILNTIFHIEKGWIDHGRRGCLDEVDHLLENNNLRDKLTNCIDTKLVLKGVQ